MSLAEKNAEQARKVIGRVGPFIETLAALADQVKLTDIARVLREQRALLDQDTSGSVDIRVRTEIVEEVLQRCYAAIVLLRSDALGGDNEREFIASLVDCGMTDLFFVVNRRDGRQADDDLRQETWYRVVNLA